jgi:hypothetical protein
LAEQEAMSQWDKALALLTHVEDYHVDYKAVRAGMEGFDVSNHDFMALVMRPRLEPKADGSPTVIGRDVACLLGERVELLPPLASQGTGTVTKVRVRGVVALGLPAIPRLLGPRRKGTRQARLLQS